MQSAVSLAPPTYTPYPPDHFWVALRGSLLENCAPSRHLSRFDDLFAGDRQFLFVLHFTCGWKTQQPLLPPPWDRGHTVIHISPLRSAMSA